ncbi:hypothetical protein FQZ97_869390 [compost metagenome]
MGLAIAMLICEQLSQLLCGVFRGFNRLHKGRMESLRNPLHIFHQDVRRTAFALLPKVTQPQGHAHAANLPGRHSGDHINVLLPDKTIERQHDYFCNAQPRQDHGAQDHESDQLLMALRRLLEHDARKLIEGAHLRKLFIVVSLVEVLPYLVGALCGAIHKHRTMRGEQIFVHHSRKQSSLPLSDVRIFEHQEASNIFRGNFPRRLRQHREQPKAHGGQAPYRFLRVLRRATMRHHGFDELLRRLLHNSP